MFDLTHCLSLVLNVARVGIALMSGGILLYSIVPRYLILSLGKLLLHLNVSSCLMLPVEDCLVLKGCGVLLNLL